ncbi:MAG: relaxase domain-containing protein [Acidimicrobiia bacterium]|nr:relaxase domain-containing protein [Acidimicrobiia bacterium]
MLSIGKIGAGAGHEYLSKGVTKDSMEYYGGKGERCGRWTGVEAEKLGLAGEIDPDSDAVEALYGRGETPEGVQMGARWATYKTWTERADDRIRGLAEPTAEKVATIRKEEAMRGSRRPCAAYDLTFSPPKSVSALWAIGDSEVASAVEAAHDAAITSVIDWIEREAAWTRTGRNGVNHERVEGLIVSRWQHRTSRSGDPQLHTHCAVLNKGRIVGDGKWRALDGQAIYASSAVGNARYLAALESELTDRLGIEWSAPTGAAREIVGIPAELRSLWSKRAADIASAVRDEVGSPEGRGRALHSGRTYHRMMQGVRLRTRAPKPDGPAPHPDELRAGWEAEMAQAGFDGDGILGRTLAPRAHVGADGVDVDQAISRVFDALHGQSSTWSTWGVEAAVRMHLPAALLDAERNHPDRVLRPDQAEQDEIIARLVDDITGQMVNVTNTVIDPNGPTGMHRWTSNRLLTAEAELVDAAHTEAVFVPPTGDVVPEFGDQLSISQRAAALGVSTSTRQLDVLVGPAGSGKTTTMRALADHWRNNGARVLGLTTSQVAADQLAKAAGIEAENTARWFAAANSRCRTYGADPSDPAQWATWGAHLEPGTLIIVDEAAMVPTLDLQRIQQAAAVAGCKVLAVGDPLQLDAPGAGGAFGLMVSDDRVNALHLEEIHRFQHTWEREASTRMREGDGAVVDLYAQHQRIHGGPEAEMYNQVLEAWIGDQATSEAVMVTQTNDQASALARAAREHLIGAGTVDTDRQVALRDGNQAGTGDVIRTRRNNREITAGQRGFVRNRDTWTVQRVHRDGCLTVKSQNGGAKAKLPRTYVDAHVELAYAGTAHAVQGRTVDAAHLLCNPNVSREALYVALTRGRRANSAWVITDSTDHPEWIDGEPATTAEAALHLAIERSPEAQSATQALRDALDPRSLRAILPAWQHHLHHEVHTSTVDALARAGLDIGEPPSALVGAIRDRYTRSGVSPQTTVAQITQASLDGANDPWAVLTARAQQVADTLPADSNEWMSADLNAQTLSVQGRYAHLRRLAADPPEWVANRIGPRPGHAGGDTWDQLANASLVYADTHSTLRQPDPLAAHAANDAGRRAHAQLMGDINQYRTGHATAHQPAQTTAPVITR